MKLRHSLDSRSTDAGKVVARFGNAALVQQRNGKWHLRGGSRSERLAAHEWISLFRHEAVIGRD